MLLLFWFSYKKTIVRDVNFLKMVKIEMHIQKQNLGTWRGRSTRSMQGPSGKQGAPKCSFKDKDCIYFRAFMSSHLSLSALMDGDSVSKIYFCLQDYLVTTLLVFPKEENFHFSKHLCFVSHRRTVLSHTNLSQQSLLWELFLWWPHIPLTPRGQDDPR